MLRKVTDMPYFHRKPVGHITICRNANGAEYKRQKQEDGSWLIIERITPRAVRVKKEKLSKEKPPKVIRVKKEKPISEKRINKPPKVKKLVKNGTRTMREAPKPAIVTLPTRQIDFSSKKSVRVNSKTIILADKNKPDELVIEEWYKKHTA